MEFSTERSNPRSAATASGSSPSEEPARAPEPYGETAARTSQSRSRSTSRSRAHAWARRWCESSTGWACWRWVRPGMATPSWRVACVDEGVDHVEDQPRDDPGVLAQVHPEERRDLVVARAPGAQPPADVGAGPVDQAALERRVDVLVVLGRAGTPRTRRRPGAVPGRRASRRARRRRAGRRAWSTRAWARDPAMSCRASRQSKWVDFAGPRARRPGRRRTGRPTGAAVVGRCRSASVTGGPSGCRTGGGRRPRGSGLRPR